MKNKIIQALIFDVDGVIVESERPKFLFLQNIFRDFGMTLPDSHFHSAAGRSVKLFLSEYLHNPVLEESIWKVFRNDYLDKITDYVAPIKETVDFIKEYDGDISLGIASSGMQEINKKLIEYFSITEKISVIVSRELVKNLKPAPDLYLKAAEKLNIDPKNCIAIEDTPIGAKAALDAGMQCYIFLNSLNQKKHFSLLDISGFISKREDIINIINNNYKI